MNVALCLSGHLRTIKECYDSHYENILKNINPDIFIHSWSDIESKTHSWHSKHMKNYPIEDSIINFIEAKYSPKSIKIEDQKNFPISGNQFGTKISLLGQKNMTYSMRESFLLKEEYSKEKNKKYDYIIKMRPDLDIKKDFLFKSIKQMDSECILFGNKKKKENYYGKINVGFSALDCLYIIKENIYHKNPLFIYDEFEEYYLRKKFINSPFLDYIIEKNIDFKICNKNLYGEYWSIKRGA